MNRLVTLAVVVLTALAMSCGASKTGTPATPDSEVEVQAVPDVTPEPEVVPGDIGREVEVVSDVPPDVPDVEAIDVLDSVEIDLCTPDCEGWVCGDDGCGGTCGECQGQDVCTEGLCVCIPDCEEKECGQDGCDGLCGECPDEHKCEAGVCKWDQCDDGNDTAWDGCHDGQIAEFQVNTTALGDQIRPEIAVLSDDRFVVVWTGEGQDGDDFGIGGRLFSQGAASLSEEFVVNSQTTLGQYDPSITVHQDGFAVAWAGDTDPDAPLEYDVYLRLFDKDSAAVGDDIQVNQYLPGDQWLPHLMSTSDGRLLVVWSSENQDGAGSGIMARWFDKDGVPEGDEVGLNTYWFSSQQDPAGAMLSDGSVAVTWSSFQQDGDLMGIFARIFDEDFAPLDEEFQTNQYLVDDQHFSHVLPLSDGGFLASWASWGQDGSKFGVYARAFGADGTASGDEFLLNSTTYSSQDHARLALLDDGRMVAVWQGNIQDGEEWGIVARLLEADFSTPTPEFVVNLYTAKDQQYPAVAPFSDAGFVVVWESFEQDGDGRGVFAALFDKTGKRVAVGQQ